MSHLSSTGTRSPGDPTILHFSSTDSQSQSSKTHKSSLLYNLSISSAIMEADLFDKKCSPHRSRGNQPTNQPPPLDKTSPPDLSVVLWMTRCPSVPPLPLLSSLSRVKVLTWLLLFSLLSSWLHILHSFHSCSDASVLNPLISLIALSLNIP